MNGWLSTTVLCASLNLTIWWSSPVLCHESLNPARHPRLSFQTHSMHRFDMLTGHDVMHSASVFLVLYLAPGRGVSRLCGFCGLFAFWLWCLLLLLLLLFFLLCWFWRVFCRLFRHDSIYTIPMISPVAFNNIVGEDGRIKRKQTQAATTTTTTVTVTATATATAAATQPDFYHDEHQQANKKK